MAKKQLFEYAVLYHPKQTKDAMGNDTTPDTELVTPITPQLASSEKEITILASRALPDTHLGHLEDIEFLVRPL